MYIKSIDIWKKINDLSIVRYICFEIIPDKRYYVQSADYYYWDSENHCIKRDDFDYLENNFFELMLDEPPLEENIFDSIEEAIENYNKSWA